MGNTKQIATTTRRSLISSSIMDGAKLAKQHTRENERRATEIGSVLEGILQSHFWH